MSTGEHDAIGDTDDAQLISARRDARVRAMLDHRLGSVVVIIEAVRRRHNTSAILRSCEAFGAHEVHLVTGTFEPSKGAARGAERWVEIHRHETTTACVQALKARGFTIYVADLADDAHSPDSVPVDAPLAVLFGSEMRGVSDEARAVADGVISVPMRGLTESLNVSVAAACTLFRVCERRRALVGGGDLEPARRRAFYEDWRAREIEAKRGREQRAANV